MLMQGIDPINNRRNAKIEAQVKGRTFEDVALDWHKDMSARWTPGHSKNVLHRLQTYVFPHIGNRSIVELDTHDLLQPLETIRQKGSIDVALRVKNYLMNIMREAKRARLISVNPTYDLEDSIKPRRATHRPALPLSRLGELQERIASYKGRSLTQLTVLLSLHLFVRSSELRFARWCEFDLDRAVWEIPDTRVALEGVAFSTRGTKMDGDVHLVPLSPQAIALLKQIQALTGGFELVFAGDANPRKPLSENTVNKALRTMGYDIQSDICGHGFRTMACSAMTIGSTYDYPALLAKRLPALVQSNQDNPSDLFRKRTACRRRPQLTHPAESAIRGAMMGSRFRRCWCRHVGAGRTEHIIGATEQCNIFRVRSKQLGYVRCTNPLQASALLRRSLESFL